MPDMPYDMQTIVRKAAAEYAAGARTKDLARKYKVSVPHLTMHMRMAGVQFRPPGADTRVVLDEQAMVADYMRGEAVLSLAAKYQVSRGVITKRLLAANVGLRSASQQALVSASHQTPEQRLARATAAHAAVRGSRKTPESLAMAAVRRQIRGSMTAKEKRGQKELAAIGIATVAQYAVEKYNIDLAIPDARVAVEMNAGWSAHGPKDEHGRIRTFRLRELGWAVINLWGPEWRPAWGERVANAVALRRDARLLGAPDDL